MRRRFVAVFCFWAWLVSLGRAECVCCAWDAAWACAVVSRGVCFPPVGLGLLQTDARGRYLALMAGAAAHAARDGRRKVFFYHVYVRVAWAGHSCGAAGLLKDWFLVYCEACCLCFVAGGAEFLMVYFSCYCLGHCDFAVGRDGAC